MLCSTTYVIKTLKEARAWVTVCQDGDDCPAFRNCALACLRQFLLELPLLDLPFAVFDIVKDDVIKAIGAISIGSFVEADDILASTLTLLTRPGGDANDG